jgi:Holliday junction DNA helicase RuvA
MIARVRGLLVDKEPTKVVVECQGIGLELRVPLSTSSRLPEPGVEVTLSVDTHFTRDGAQLFGFAAPDEREVFRHLTSVKGIGPRAGLNLLSRLSPDEIRAAIAAGRVEVMRSVPGIGPKKADSIIKKLQEVASEVPSGPSVAAEAESALVSLGLTRKEARSRLTRVPAGLTGLQEVLRRALALRDE